MARSGQALRTNLTPPLVGRGRYLRGRTGIGHLSSAWPQSGGDPVSPPLHTWPHSPCFSSMHTSSWAQSHFGCASIQVLPMEDEGGSGTKGSHWEQTLFAVRGGWGRPRSKASLTVISQPSCHLRLTIGAPTHLSIPSPHAPCSHPFARMT